MQTLTGMHRHIRTHTYDHTHTHTQTCSHDRPSHSPNQFHSQASCQAAMLSKYIHNACVSVNVQLMNGWHPVKLRDTETDKLPTHCYCALTRPKPPLHLHATSLTSNSCSLHLCDFLSLALRFRGHFFLFSYRREKARRSAQQRRRKNGCTLQLGYLWIWRFSFITWLFVLDRVST